MPGKPRGPRTIQFSVGWAPGPADVLVIPCVAVRGKPRPFGTAFAGMALAPLIDRLSNGWSLGIEPGSLDSSLKPGDPRFSRIAMVSIGESEHASHEAVRSAAASMARWCQRFEISRVTVAAEGMCHQLGDSAMAAWAEAVVLASFRYHRFKTKPRKSEYGGLRAVDFVAHRTVRPSVRAAIQRAVTIAECVNIARQMGHEPPNIINPVTLASEVQRLARKEGLKCRVLDERQLAAARMHAMLAVGRGSATPPRLIVLEHGAPSNKSPVALVGKAVTLDTGGYSIKPADGIPDMKYDKCGGMAVLGVMVAAARLRYKRPLVGVIAAAENMISHDAYRPGDILTAMNGTTIEVANTDAEGRLILADALTWVQRRYKPSAVMDLATLTGACTVALGHHAAALYCNDDALATNLYDAGQQTGDKVWRMPLWPEYRRQIEGADADLKNTGGRPAGSITAAKFLQEFVEGNTPWAHLDIAGTAHTEKDTPLCPKGATGFGVRLLAHHLRI